MQMKPRHLLIFLVLAAVLLQDTDAWGRWRFRFRLRRIICRLACYKVCSSGIGCHMVCNRVCKRDIQIPDYMIESKDYKVVPVSSNFNHYDVDKDGFISIDEFAAAEGVPREELENVFQINDINGDGLLDQSEFERARFVNSENEAEEMNERARALHRGDIQAADLEEDDDVDDSQTSDASAVEPPSQTP